MTLQNLIEIAAALVEAEDIEGADAIVAIAERHLSSEDLAAFNEAMA